MMTNSPDIIQLLRIVAIVCSSNSYTAMFESYVYQSNFEIISSTTCMAQV